MQKLLSLITVCAFVALCNAQPQHVGVLFNAQFEGRNSGNGTIIGMEVQNVHHFKPYLRLASNLQITGDQKVYRGQYGGAVRGAGLLRFAPDKNHLMFAQFGGTFGAVLYPDKPGADDGYAKYGMRPVVGGGVTLPVDVFTATIDYQWHARQKLFAQKNELNDFRNRFLDGWTSGHKVSIQTTTEISENYLLLLNGSYGQHSYQRNSAVYGATLGSVVHKFPAFEVSIGIGRKY